MLEEQVANLLQRYLGNYVRGLSKEALRISFLNGDVELTNMQLKPEALNALKLPVKVKAGFLGSVKLKIPWSRLGQDPVLVYLDRIFLLAEPATLVEGGSEDAVQEAKRNRIRDMEMKLLERAQHLKTEEVNKSWLGSLISTIIGNLKLSISNIHIRYEDGESNPGHPFAVGVTLDKLSAFTVDDYGNETFVTGGALDHIQKSVELQRLALYFDSDISPWHLDKPWEDLLPNEWSQAFKVGTKDGKVATSLVQPHSYILEPISGKARYIKLRPEESRASSQPLQKAEVRLDDVTLCLSKDCYRDMVKLADNFAAFNQRLQYAHYRPLVPVKSGPRAWWKYAYKAVSDQLKKASGKLSWEQVLKYAKLRKKYISVYASLLKSDPTRAVVDDDKEIEELDRELDIDLILQWRMVAHRFVEKSMESDLRKQREKKSWWPFGWGSTSASSEGEAETLQFGEEDWERLNRIIGYKEAEEGEYVDAKKDVIHTAFEVYMTRNASKLIDALECVAELSCESLKCCGTLYSEAKIFDLKLGSYRLSSPSGLLAQSAAAYDSLVGTFAYKPLGVDVDWSLVAKASPCYMTYLKDSVDQMVKFFESTTVSHTLAVETAAAVQMTIDEMKRTAQERMSRALKDQSRFVLDLDIAAPKITIPTEFRPDNMHPTKLMLDLGNLIIRTKDDRGSEAPETMNMYLQFDMVLSDVSAFLADGDYYWSRTSSNEKAASATVSDVSLLPVIDKCGVVLRLQQIKVPNPLHPSTRVAMRVPSLGFHFSPARYHRLMQVMKTFEEDDEKISEHLRPWSHADFEGWASLLTWKGVGNREAVWQQRYFCLVGPFLYILENPAARTYKQCVSLRGKLLYKVPPEIVGNEEHVLAIYDATRIHSQGNKVVEQANALILRFDSDDSESIWHSRLQSAIYRASASAPITTLSESSSDSEDSEGDMVKQKGMIDISIMEKIFITGILDELKVSFSYNRQSNQNFKKMLLSKEEHLFEFRAIGGLVEVAIKGNDMFIGTILQSLEIEDLVCGGTSPRCYLARSFIRGRDVTSALEVAVKQSCNDHDFSSESDDKFYEASESLPETDSSSGNFSPKVSAFRPPSFSKVPGLLPDSSFQSMDKDMGRIDELDSFVKAQIVIYDQNSPFYSRTDNMVVVTLATLSFFCRRPTIAAVMEFVNEINVEDESPASFSDGSATVTPKHDVSGDDFDSRYSTTDVQSVVKGLLGKGKSRVIFHLVLNMARAQIVLMKEDETKLATLSQDNLLTDMKVFPSSFSIKAAIGNLRISDDSLPPEHFYFWACDMRNPGGSSFVEMLFSSYSPDDDDYKGYDYSLFGRLSEVRIVFLYRFVQEVVSYFSGLAPTTPNGVVKLTDQVTDAEKWFTTSEIEGSPAVKLDLSLTKPIIVMPRKTNSLDYLELDVVHITVKNTFQWLNGSRHDTNAVHEEILTVLVEDINLNVGTGKELGGSIIQEVNGLSVIVRRSLRDLFHQIPRTEATIEMNVLKAALSNKEYEIITECALSNLSETPNIVPPLSWDKTFSADTSEFTGTSDLHAPEVESSSSEVWIDMKVIVAINLVELSLHKGTTKDSPLATVQVDSAWLLYKSTTAGDGFVSVTLQSFNVLDDREGTQERFRLAIGRPKSIEYSPFRVVNDEDQPTVSVNTVKEQDTSVAATMLIFDAKFSEQSSSISLCVQRPQLLVALDFLLAVIEFFAPTVRGMLSSEEEDISMDLVDAIILNESIYIQPSAEFAISPNRPLVVDSEGFDHYIYDGNGGRLLLKDRQGHNISSPSTEAMIFVGNGKRLQFKNVHIKDGRFLDSCVVLGANSSYSVSEYDHVVLEGGDEQPSPVFPGNEEVAERRDAENGKSSESVIELQVISPELTFYNTSRNVGESLILSNKLLHAQLDALCRVVLKGETMEMTGNVLGLTMESNGIRILEPFDASVNFSNVAGKTNIRLCTSDIFMNFSFSILRLFLAVEEDILTFLRMTSRKMTISCSEFDKVAIIGNLNNDQVYTFWRPQAPPGFAVLGDYLTPVDKPPTTPVLAVNMNLVKIKRPESFILIWPRDASSYASDPEGITRVQKPVLRDVNCSIWYPVAPKGYVAVGCVASSGAAPPPLSSSFCILASLVSRCPLRDCIMIGAGNGDSPATAFWRVDNCLGTFLPAESSSLNLVCGAYDLRHIFFGASEFSEDVSSSSHGHVNSSRDQHPAHSATADSGQRFQAVASFHLVWWNQGSASRKKLSIWRPVVPQGMVYFGDIAVKGYEPPSSCIVAEDIGDELFKEPIDFKMVGKIKKQRGMEPISFWLPLAPPGYVSLGCVACKVSPRNADFSSLRCIRSDMVTGDQFSEESIWDAYDAGLRTEPFSIWTVGDELGTFMVRSGNKKPPKRFAMKLAHKSAAGGLEDTVIDAEISAFSAACFDDFGGLMVPLFNVSLSGIGFNLHGRLDYLNSAVSFSLAARSYNDKYDAWEPVVEPMDGFLRYEYDLSSPGATSQLRLTSAKDLNLNISSSNANMILQACASWSNLGEVHESYVRREVVSSAYKGSSGDVHQKRDYFIIPQNKLGQDIYIRASEVRGLSSVIKMPSGDTKHIKIPVSRNMLDSHLRGNVDQKVKTMVMLMIAEAQFQRVPGISSRQYAVAIRLIQESLSSNGTLLIPSNGALLNQQSVRTCGRSSEFQSSGLESVKWNEVFFFKVDSLENYRVELTVADIGRGEPIGFFSACLNQIAATESAYYQDYAGGWNWVDLFPPGSKMVSKGESSKASLGRLQLAVFLSSKQEVADSKQHPSSSHHKKTGFIQISPAREGPWTTVRLNYAAPVACWRLGNAVVASEVSVKDGNRYVNIRSLVSVHNETDFTLDVRLKAKALSEAKMVLNDEVTSEKSETNNGRIDKVEFFEIEKFVPDVGWVCCSGRPSNNESADGVLNEGTPLESPCGWIWVDDWHLDNPSADSTDGWAYAPDQESLKWPNSYDAGIYVNNVRQRKWIRNRKQTLCDDQQHVSIGLVKPRDSVPLPLSCLTQAGPYVLQLRPLNLGVPDEYAWSKVMSKCVEFQVSGKHQEESEIYVSDLEESEKLLYCSQVEGNSSNDSHGIWFCLNVQAVEIAKDIRSDPIQDWSLVVRSPLSVTNYLPLRIEYSVLERHSNDQLLARARGIFFPGKAVNFYCADIRKALFLSLLPQKGWVPMHQAVPISQPSGMPSQTLHLRSSISGRIVQVVLEQNHGKDQPMPKAIRIYVPYWFSVSRCPPVVFKLVDRDERKARKISLPLKSRRNDQEIIGKITEDEFHEGYTIASSLNFKVVGLQASIAYPGGESFGPIKNLSPLSDMDGSVDVFAYDGEGNCMRLFITSKPCPYQSIPTKVITIRPYMTFTNRVGRDMYIKLSSEDDEKVLRASDSRVCFIYKETSDCDKLQVRLADTRWSFPIGIAKEDTIFLVLRKENGERVFLRTEVRGYEEGSRFVIVFRLGSTLGPIRIENRTSAKTISIRQCGFDDDHWIHLMPLSTTNFSWDDPYGQKGFDVRVCSGSGIVTSKINLETTTMCSLEGIAGLQFHMAEVGNIKVARFTEESSSKLISQADSQFSTSGNWRTYHMQRKMPDTVSPLELTIEVGVLGLSVIDHRPRELSYLYMERVYIAYCTGYDGGTTSRFKVILGHLQVDNQLPLTVMPVLLAPEQTDIQQPVFKMTLTMRNENTDGIQVFPYTYIRVTEKCWRLNIHEPIIWAVMDFYNSLQLDRLPRNQNVTQVDPEIRIDLIDVSEVRLKVSLETAPAQRPHGVLGVWSPILSALGSAFKIQIHLRKVVHRNRFMRRSSLIPAITNRIWRDLVHNPLHLIFSVDVLGMTRSTLASLSKGFAELSTDGQFLQLRSKQVWSRRITSVGDGIIQGTEALAQGVAFGVSGVVRKPVESARQNGVLGLAHGLGRAFIGFIVQPVSGALDFLSLTVGGVGASCARCFEILSNRSTLQRVRNPRAIHSDGILREYNEGEAIGQMLLWLAEASHRLGCTEIFKEPSKFAWSDYYEDHFMLPQQRIVLVTNKRVMLLQCKAPDVMDKKPSKILWDVPWEELLALELAKSGSQPSHLILHLKHFKKSEAFARVVKCKAEEETEGRVPQAVKICSAVRKMWKAYQSDMKSLTLKVPSSQRYVHFSWNEADGRDLHSRTQAGVMSREASISSSSSNEGKFVEHSINFSKIWSSEQESKGRCSLCGKKALEDGQTCSIWRPACPSGYVSVGDVARVGGHPPNVAAVYRYNEQKFALPVGFDLAWRNCPDDYVSPVSIWLPRSPDGFLALGCVAVAGFNEPENNIVYCVAESLAEDAEFEAQKIWSAPDAYPWACHIYQVQSSALHFVALRQPRENADWKPKRVRENTDFSST